MEFWSDLSFFYRRNTWVPVLKLVWCVVACLLMLGYGILLSNIFLIPFAVWLVVLIVRIIVFVRAMNYEEPSIR